MKVILLFLLALQVCLSQTAGIRGQVTDESGAVIPGAKVTLRGPSNFEKSLTAANDGTYSFTGLTAGDYTIQAAAPELAMPAPAKLSVRTGVLTVNIQLKV